MDEMKELVVCPVCKQHEYYGMMYSWTNGIQACRVCTYERWEEETKHQWHPSALDYTFPLYSDGVDYTQAGGEY